MSETTPDPADVHTGTDRVELTNDERAQMPSYTTGVQFAAVESIVAARVAALTAERDELRERIATLEEYLNER